MPVADAEDDDLLLRAAMFAKAVEEVLAHGGDALGQQEVAIEVSRLIAILEVSGLDVAAGPGVHGLGGEDLLAGEASPVYGWPELDDLAGGQVTIFLGLNQAVFIDGFAKVLDVMGGDLFVRVGLGFARPFGCLQFTRRGREPDLNGLGIAPEDLGPAAPGRAVALVDDNDGKGILGVVFRQEAGESLVLVVEAQSLVGRDMDFGVPGGVEGRSRQAAFGLDDAHAALGEGHGQLFPGLLAQFVAIADKEGGFGEAAGLVQSPEQIGGEDGFARARGQGKKDADGQAGTLLDQNFIEGSADGRVLVITRLVEGRAVGHEEQGGFGGGEVNAQVTGVAPGQFVVGGEALEGKGAAWHSGPFVEFGITVAIGAENISHREARAVRIAMGLLHPFERIGGFGLGLDHPHGQGCRHLIGLDAQEVIGPAAPGPPAPLGADRLHWSGSLQFDPPLTVTLGPQHRVDEFKTGFGLVVSQESLHPG